MNKIKTSEIKKSYFKTKVKIIKKISKLIPETEIDDILQESFVRLIISQKSQTIKNIDQFIIKIANNLALDYLKKSDTKNLVYIGAATADIEQETIDEKFTTNDLNIQPGLTYFSYPSDDDPLLCAIKLEEISNVTRVINTLPNKCKTTFIMKKIYGLSQKEIARKLNITESAVEKHIINGMSRCTDFLLKYKV